VKAFLFSEATDWASRSEMNMFESISWIHRVHDYIEFENVSSSAIDRNGTHSGWP
jgi:hypothetical protein